MDATQFFDRGRSVSEAKKNKKSANTDTWKGAEDVEKLAAIFTNYLTQTHASSEPATDVRVSAVGSEMQ